MAGQADNYDLMANYVGKQSNPRRPTGDTRRFISECKFCGRSRKRNKEPMVNFVLVVVRETILMIGVCRNHKVREIHLLQPRYMQ